MSGEPSRTVPECSATWRRVRGSKLVGRIEGSHRDAEWGCVSRSIGQVTSKTTQPQIRSNISYKYPGTDTSVAET